MTIQTRWDNPGFPASVRRFFSRALPAMGMGFMLMACTLPSFLFKQDDLPPAEKAAQAAMRRIEDAQSKNASIPRWRYENIITQYPHTAAAYEANLILAAEDFTALDTQRRTSASRRNLMPGFVEFVETYGFGSHSQPEDPQIAVDYLRELHPRLYDALSWMNDYPLQFRYIERFPETPASAKLRESIEARLVVPSLRWDAVSLFESYAQVEPASPNLAAIQDQIEQNLMDFIQEFGTKKDCDQFLERFPDSVYREQIELIEKGKVL